MNPANTPPATPQSDFPPNKDFPEDAFPEDAFPGLDPQFEIPDNPGNEVPDTTVPEIEKSPLEQSPLGPAPEIPTVDITKPPGSGFTEAHARPVNEHASRNRKREKTPQGIRGNPVLLVGIILIGSLLLGSAIFFGLKKLMKTPDPTPGFISPANPVKESTANPEVLNNTSEPRQEKNPVRESTAEGTKTPGKVKHGFPQMDKDTGELIPEIEKPLSDGKPDENPAGKAGEHFPDPTKESGDSPFLPDDLAMPQEMIDGEVIPTTGLPAQGNPQTPEESSRNTDTEQRSVISQARTVAPQEDPEFQNRRQKLREEELKFEPVDLKVQHTITALFPPEQNTPPQKIRLDVPVIHESHVLALTPQEIESLRQLAIRTREYQKHIQDLQEEGVSILREWNEIQRAGSPEAILLPDSPSLIDNQGSTRVTGQKSPLSGKEPPSEQLPAGAPDNP